MTVINDKMLLKERPIPGMLERGYTVKGTSIGLSVAGYDLIIDQDVSFYPMAGLLPFVVTRDQDTGRRKFRFGRFALASAAQAFNMPANLVGVVHDKSTWARRALSVFNTVIEPGWQGYLTLELVYHGWFKPLHIKAGQGIAQVLFHRLAVSTHYKGKYQNQAPGPQPAKEF